ncbi:MAG: mucoidy inhibitor MuiA family protein [Geminicoccaceae bacterium]|nr:mucoidy inhibitor MuiA family protein [Geminicoccaceae bacterium]
MFIHPAGLAALLLLPLASALAADIEGTSRIDAVTVYGNGAQVTRVVKAQVSEGTHRVILTGLPLSMRQQSLRGRGGGESWTLGRVSLVERESSELVRERERELVQEIEALESQQRVRRDRIETERRKLSFIQRLGDTAGRQIDEDLERGALDPSLWRESWETLGAGTAEALETIRLAEEDLAHLQKRADRARRELEQLSTGARAVLEAAVDVRAERAGEVMFELVYQVDGASWQPQYDARLASAERQLTLIQYGSVSQGTGEDWENVALELSTTTPARGDVPELRPWRIDVARPPVAMRSAQGVAQDMAMSESVAEPMAKAGAAPVMAQAVVSEFSASYRVDGRVSVPSDRSAHRMIVDRVTAPVDLRAEAVPKFDARAYLIAGLTHTGEAPFPSGEMTLFRDDALIGTSHLRLLRKGETRDLSFGVDDAIDIDYRLDTGGRSSEGIISSYRREERRFLIDATSHHATPIELTILDQLPVPQDERIEVGMLDDTTPPTVTDDDDRRGVLAWTRSLAPGEEMKLKFGYAVTWPEDLRIDGF